LACNQSWPTVWQDWCCSSSSLSASEIASNSETGGVVGRVGARSTCVHTYDNEIIIVPNSEFTTHKVINWTVNDDRVRLSINVVVAHDSDPHRVAELLL
jgi:potassium-dependent mechanosensitive channel